MGRRLPCTWGREAAATGENARRGSLGGVTGTWSSELEKKNDLRATAAPLLLNSNKPFILLLLLLR